MPLKGSEKNLGKKLSETMKTAGSYEEAWTAFAETLIAHILQNAVVTEVAPSGGGPVTKGLIG
ncbi:MAG: hypothetical protein EOP48_29625 [Sphingobacteriales bacterium]|nr:MAG: hypothetical protein EOP48_29625 [Sphingobacteriales bacterium]